jgi:hypothetical protein
MSKIHYLIHLDDCRRTGLEDLIRSAKALNTVVTAVKSPDFRDTQAGDQQKLLDNLCKVQADIRFLNKRLRNLAKPITAVREQIIEQMGLASGQRTIILTVLAALYIPLSFVSVSHMFPYMVILNRQPDPPQRLPSVRC